MPSTTAAQKRADAKGATTTRSSPCALAASYSAGFRQAGCVLIRAALGDDGPQQPGVESTGEPRSMRYSWLSRRLAGLSQKMLTQTLRSLERDELSLER